MKISMFGGRGNIGQSIAREALSRGHSVRAIMRDAAHVEGLPEGVEVVTGDAADGDSVAAAVAGSDAIISAIGPNGAAGQSPSILIDAAHGLIAGAKKGGVKRILVVGGAGTLEVEPGIQAVDRPDFPERARPNSLAQREVLSIYGSSESDGLDWTYVSPAGTIAAGERLGHYRQGFDQMLYDDHGESRISYEDYAIGMIGELESGANRRRRITFAY